jgi:thiamine-monophosphate kinase
MIEDKTPNKTSLSELGEFGLINHLTEHFKISQKSTKKGVGDDAAVIDHGGLKTLVTTDLLVEGIHFNLTYMPLKHLGYKAVMVNLSDVYAMNGNATQNWRRYNIFSNRFTYKYYRYWNCQ